MLITTDFLKKSLEYAHTLNATLQIEIIPHATSCHHLYAALITNLHRVILKPGAQALFEMFFFFFSALFHDPFS